MELNGKIALITAAGGIGMGKAMALAFAREGADIAVNDIILEKAEATAAEVRKLGGRALAIKADVASHAEVNRMVDSIVREWGGIDILVNNAGTGNRVMVEDMTEAEWHRILGICLDGNFYCSRAVLPSMKSRGGGKIIIISSLAAKKMSLFQCAAYTASKSGLLGFTRQLAYEVGPYKINVNAICPGATLAPEARNRIGSERIQQMKNSNPLKDICSPEDIADLAVFLASAKAKMITGSAFDIDAGEFIAAQNWEAYVTRRKEAFARGDTAY